MEGERMRRTGRTYVVNRQHRAASDRSVGTERRPFKTIDRAAQLAQPGDTVLVYPGLYRERVCPARGGAPDRPIVYRAAERGAALISGSAEYAGPWIALHGEPGVFRGALGHLDFGPDNPYAMALQRRPGQCLGQVFVDGQPLAERQSDEEVVALPGSWRAVQQGAAILVHLPGGLRSPRGVVVELTVRPRVFAPLVRGLGYLTVRGFTLEHAANNYCHGFWAERGLPQAGLLGCRGGHHWTIEENEIRYAKTFGLDIGYEGPRDADGLGQPPCMDCGYHLIRTNHIHHNGAGGICGCGCPETRILDNRIEYNETLATAADESGGIKLHFAHRVRIEGNLIRGNDCSGVWLDNNWREARITRNCIVGNAGAGVFMELGDGPMLIDNNVIAYTRGGMSLAGDGIYSHDASGVTVAHNLLWFNTNFGVWSHVGSERGVNFFQAASRRERQAAARAGAATGFHGYVRRVWPELAGRRRPAEQSRWSVLNNLILGSGRGAMSLPPAGPRSRGNRSESNVLAAGYDLRISETFGSPMDQPLFVLNTNKDRVPLTQLAQRLKSLAAPLRPNAALWREFPLLTLPQWRQLTGWDRRSGVPILLRPRLGCNELVVEFIMDDAAARACCRPVPGVTRDYHGRRLPRRPLAGPFQALQAAPELADGRDYSTPNRGPYEKLRQVQAVNRFPLWPVRAVPPSACQPPL
jgi:parallel beta-helix repeat protein